MNNENKSIIKAIDMFGRVPEQWELLEEIERLTISLQAQEELTMNEHIKVERLNNIINELKEWFKGYHKSYASCKWYEEDYIEFIEHLENELKGDDKE